MKKLINKAKNTVSKVKNLFKKVEQKVIDFLVAEMIAFQNIVLYVKTNGAEGYVDTGVKVLISVVIGGLLLALLYTLFNETIMPTVTTKVVELFGYTG